MVGCLPNKLEALCSIPGLQQQQKKSQARRSRLTPVILATQESEIRICQPGQIVWETLSQKILYKNRAGGVAQGVG
jgi:hypothetical protein